MSMNENLYTSHKALCNVALFVMCINVFFGRESVIIGFGLATKPTMHHECNYTWFLWLVRSSCAIGKIDLLY